MSSGPEFTTISLGEFERGDAHDKQRISTDVDRICCETGFLALRDHGVPEPLVDAVWRASRAFFDLPLAAKLAVKPPVGDPYGYFPAEAESLAGSLGDETPPDLKESFNIGPLEKPPGLVAEDAANFCYAQNYWPDRPAGFRQSWLDYYREMDVLAHRIMVLFAAALGVDDNYFDTSIDHAISAMRALNYPDTESPPLPDQLRAGAHTDYGSLTILLPDPHQAGLEIRLPSGEWWPVPVTPGAFVINIGDLMARWTNDRWVSTLHRVTNPPANAAGSTRRQSIVFFHQPNWDAEIRCIETCLVPDKAPLYAPIGSGAHLMRKFTDTVVGDGARALEPDDG